MLHVTSLKKGRDSGVHITVGLATNIVSLQQRDLERQLNSFMLSSHNFRDNRDCPEHSDILRLVGKSEIERRDEVDQRSLNLNKPTREFQLNREWPEGYPSVRKSPTNAVFNACGERQPGDLVSKQRLDASTVPVMGTYRFA